MQSGVVMSMTTPIMRARAAKGAHMPGEGRMLTDAASGRRVRQVTDHPSIHHHPFFFLPA